MVDAKRKAIDHIIELEGGYVNDPDDSGGETNFGITVAVARANGYHGPMRDMPREVAFDIYSAKYWDAVRADDFDELVAVELVDTAVNMGVGRAGKFLQRSLNAINDAGLVVDGAIGPATVRAYDAYMAKRNDAKTLEKALDSLQGAFYIELTERRSKDRKFAYGWIKNRTR